MKERLGPALRPLAALLFALLLGGALIALAQRDAGAAARAYGALVRGGTGDADAVAATLEKTMPLLLTGAAVALALAAGLFNIGAEGQMAVGALASVGVGFGLIVAPPPLRLALGLLAGAAAGGLWAHLPARLKARRGVHEVITAILLNYVAQNLTRFLASGPLREPGGGAPQTPEIAAALPRLLPDYDVHAGLLIALAALALAAVALQRTVWGYEIRFAGAGADAAEASGIAVDAARTRAMWVSGALAGLAGAVVVCGAAPFRRFPADFYGVGYGFDGLAVGMLAGAAPGNGALWAVAPAALLFGALGAGAEAMSFETGTPRQIVQVVEALLIVAVGARFALRRHAR